MGGLALTDGLQHGLMGRGFRHQHRHIAADGGELGQRLECLGRIPPREQQVVVGYLAGYVESVQAFGEFAERKLQDAAVMSRALGALDGDAARKDAATELVRIVLQERLGQEKGRLSARQGEIIRQQNQNENQSRNRHFEEMMRTREELKRRTEELAAKAKENPELAPELDKLHQQISGLDNEIKQEQMPP